MAFVAAIDNPKNIASWARACSSLAGVSDQVSFTVSATEVTMLAVNASKTTHGEIGFQRDFFKEITFNTVDIVQDGFSERSSTYSFVVSSKHLVMLLKNSDPHTLNYVCLRVECSSSTPSMRQYKLGVEILTKTLVLKKYQIGFLPVEYKATDIPMRYEMLWQGNDLCKFSIEAPIIKSFLDTAHTLAEDFGVETRSSNIIFSAYTKQVVKDRDYLKQPMSISIQMAVDDLPDSNLGDTKLCLNFRLRDFKNFIGLVSSLRVIDVANLDTDSMSFDALFQAAGDPILFRHEGQNISIKFIQMTTDDSGAVSKQDTRTYVITAPIVQKRKSGPEPEKEKQAKKRNAKKSKTSSEPEADVFDAYDAFDPTEGLVTYEARERNSPEPTFLERTPSQDEGTDYNTSGNESPTEFGPTQAADRPEPLFR